MRITSAAKEDRRQRILDAAVEQFQLKGFDAATTRDIARQARIASGTIFNYFTTKEAILANLAAEALARGRADFARKSIEGDLEENLFALVAAELRQLKPLRKFLRPLIETALSPLAAADRCEAGDSFRFEHLEIVCKIAGQQGLGELSAVALQMYWALYLGVLAFWATDKSPKQEDTLALLDESLAMFVAWLRNSLPPTSMKGET